MGYDAVGNLSGYTYPNGVQISYNYDTLKLLTQMGSEGCALLALFETWDSAAASILGSFPQHISLAMFSSHPACVRHH